MRREAYEQLRAALSQPCCKAVDLAAPKLNRKEIEVDVTSPEDVYAEIDPVLIQRLISNLLSNAARYARSQIRVSCSSMATRMVIDIDDDGTVKISSSTAMTL